MLRPRCPTGWLANSQRRSLYLFAWPFRLLAFRADAEVGTSPAPRSRLALAPETKAGAMIRASRILVVLLLPLLVVAGCGGAHSTSTPPASVAADSEIPADPSESAADAQPIDEGCPTSNTISFAKTKFVLHSGLAFGAFHRYLYKPYQAGTFKKGASGRITAFIKGGLAALFVKREIRLAAQDVKANPTLCKAIAAPLGKIGDTVQAAFDKLKTGDASGITGVNSLVSSVEGTSKSNGVEVTENDNPDLSAKPS